MKRDIEGLASRSYDLIVIGGGAYGACTAWDAAQRGLSVALLDREDFGGATSANSAKIGHGGLRYLQHADFRRMRESIKARSTLMRIAPHLVYYQPFLMPTYGHGVKGPEVMRAALAVNDLISLDRKWVKDPSKRIPDARVVSKEKCLKLVPGIRQENLTGGAIWFDGQLVNTERLTFAFVQSASAWGARAANYCEVTGFLRERGRITGVRFRDRLRGEIREVKAKYVVNTAGPWVRQVLGLSGEVPLAHSVPLSKAFSVITRPVTEKYALAMSTRPMYQDADSIVNKGANLIFAIPWRGLSLIGSLHLPFTGHPDKFEITEKEIEDFLGMVNQAYPAAKLTRGDVRYVLGGIVPAAAEGSAAPLKHFHLLDHSKDGVQGIASVVGVKYTTVRNVAEKTVDLVFDKLHRKSPRCRTAETPVRGGEIEDLQSFIDEQLSVPPWNLAEGIVRRLIVNYGNRYGDVFEGIDDPAWLHTLPGTSILRAEVLHAVRTEMAVRLSDVIFRRTELGSAGHPGDNAVAATAEIMAAELGWNRARLVSELTDVEKHFARHGVQRTAERTSHEIGYGISA